MAEKSKKTERTRELPRSLPEEEDAPSGTIDDLLTRRHCEDCAFTDLDLAGGRIGELSGSNLVLEGVSFANCEVSSVRWFDVRLVRCDLSNATLRHLEATRVEFVECKLIGLNALGCRLQDVLFQSCDASFAQLSESRVRRSEFRDCNLREAAITYAELEGTVFASTVLRKADLVETSLAKVDLRTCNIEEIALRVEDLRGAIVNPAQAMDLSRFLGVIVS